MRRTALVALALSPRDAGTSAFRWLCSALRAAILEGRLRPGARLPATRDLARQCRVSRGTIVTAFEQLKSEGYISARTGSGTYVNTVLPDSLLEVAQKARAPFAQRPARRLSDLAARAHPFRASAPSRARAFRANQPALDLFPTTLWAQVAGRTLRHASIDELRGGDPLGYEPLRKAVADYLHTARGVSCAFEQLVIVSGVQEALDRWVGSFSMRATACASKTPATSARR
jgi:GntR family transcriptional regulator / MocR family aminotransferase